MSLEQGRLHLEQLESGRVLELNKHSDLFDLVEATRLRNRWAGDRPIGNTASARLYPLGPIIFDGRRWDCLEVEVGCTGSSAGTSGVCLWVGRRIPKVLFEGRDVCGVRDTFSFDEECVGSDRRGYFTDGNRDPRLSVSRKELFPSQSTREGQQEENSYSSFASHFAPLAKSSLMEAYEPK